MKQVESRIPATKHILKNVGFLCPCKVFSQTASLCFSKLLFTHPLHEEHDLMEQHYHKLWCINWVEENVFNRTLPADAVQFWSDVLQYKNGVGQYSFKKLAEYVLACLKYL